jgi:hypothetical protein
LLAEEIAAPLGLDLWIWLPKARIDLDAVPEPVRDVIAAFADPTSLTVRSLLTIITPPLDHNACRGQVSPLAPALLVGGGTGGVVVVEPGADVGGAGVVQVVEDGEGLLPGVAGGGGLAGGMAGIAEVAERRG